MQKYFKLKFLVIILITLLFSGCSLGGASKKTEISLNSGNDVNNANEQANDMNNNTNNNEQKIDNVQKIEDPIESSTETSKAQSIAGSTSAQLKTPTTSTAPTEPAKLKITDRLVSWGFATSSGRKIDTIIIHSSYNAVGSDEHNLDDIINKEYKPAGVSPHYIIDRAGKVSRLVKDQNIAYHAGVSKVPDGRTNVNDFSLGIEIVETESESPNSAQYSALKSLLNYLKSEYKIKYVLGHSDIAPGRKTDSWGFDWGKVGGKVD